MVKNVLVITLGAGAGACLRWVLAMLLNSIFPAIPLGTVAANFIGGFGIGLSLGVFNAMPGLAPEWRLLIITGFLGGLTTFSSFSNETLQLLLDGRSFAALLNVAVNVLLGLTFTYLGIKAII